MLRNSINGCDLALIDRSEHPVERRRFEALVRLGVLPVIVVFYGAAAFQFDFTPDETYVYLRLASNLVEGAGFGFNPGLGGIDVPGPLWVLILAAAKAGGLDPYVAAKILDLLFASITLLVLSRLAATVTGNHFLGLIAVGLAAFDPFYLSSAAGGTGGSLEVLLLFLTILYLYRTEYVLASLAGAVFTLLRPEGILLFLIVQSDNLLNTTSLTPVRKIAFLSALLYAAIVLPWVAFRMWEFGSVIPSDDVRTIATPTILSFGSGWVTWLTQVLPGFSFVAGMMLALRQGAVRNVLLEVYPLLVVVGVFLAGVVFNPEFTAGSLRMILPLVAILGTWGMKKMIDFWTLEWRRALALVGIVVFPTIVANSAFYQTIFVPSMMQWRNETDQGLKPIAYRLRSSLGPGAVIEASMPGYLGYVSDRVVVRHAGSVSPQFVVDRSGDSTRLSAHGLRPVRVETVSGDPAPIYYTLYQKDQE